MNCIKITAGTLLKKKLTASDQLKYIRPFSERIRRNIFTILGSHIIGANILDIFAGSGICSIEALSRGAKNALVIDNNPIVIKYLYKNIKNLNLENSIKIYKENISHALKNTHIIKKNYDVIFLDPPYNICLNKIFWDKLIGVANKKSIIIYRSKSIRLDPRFKRVGQVGKYVFLISKN